ncbi:hypothetical protein V7112_18355 [Bacillus sp. JJ1566]|uniref:hypothetical protein n=1 Tax=Bacillus sp. JJ1566 TaxID=3122961 RepID=UPI002FFE0164
MKKLYIIVFSILLAACSNPSGATTEDELLKMSEELFVALESHDWTTISEMTHPDGLTFSLFADLGSPTSNEVILNKETLKQAEQVKVTWGVELTGLEVIKTKDEYVEEYIFKSIYGNPLKYDTVNFNSSSVESGGVINTISKNFPDAKYVEYFSEATEDEYDWQALRFVFKERQGEWFLFGIVRDVHNP